MACEASDSAPSSSGVSSIPTDTTIKQSCDDIIQEYHSYNVRNEKGVSFKRKRNLSRQLFSGCEARN